MIGRLLTRAKPPDVQPSMAMTMGGPWPFASSTIDTMLPVVTEEAALDLPVTSGFLNILCSLVLQMPLGAYAGNEQVPTTPQVLRNPAPGPNRVFHDFVCEYARDMALHGNYMAVLGDPAWDGWPNVMYPVPFGQWSMTDDGYYRIGADLYRPQDVFHVRRGCRTGEHMGRGLLETHRRLVAGCVAAEDWAAQYFTGGAVPPVAVHAPDLTLEQALALKAQFDLAARSRKAVVSQTATTITPLNSDAEKAQLGESRKWGAQQMAIALGIPGAMLGLDSPSLTYRNITDVFQQFISLTVMSYLTPLEMQLTMQCLPRTLMAKFDPSALLRPDLAARVELAAKGIAAGIYTPAEARALVDLPPDPAGAPEEPQEPAPTLTLVPEAAP